MRLEKTQGGNARNNYQSDRQQRINAPEERLEKAGRIDADVSEVRLGKSILRQGQNPRQYGYRKRQDYKSRVR